MATEASKLRRKQRHAAEKAAKKAARELPVVAPTKEELEASEQMERRRNLPRGTWLNGKLYRNSQGKRANRPGESQLHVEAEQANHDRSVALKHTVSNETLPEGADYRESQMVSPSAQ